MHEVNDPTSKTQADGQDSLATTITPPKLSPYLKNSAEIRKLLLT